MPHFDWFWTNQPRIVASIALQVAKHRGRMTVDRIFLAYMVLIGVAAGAALVLAPQLENSVIK